MPSRHCPFLFWRSFTGVQEKVWWYPPYRGWSHSPPPGLQMCQLFGSKRLAPVYCPRQLGVGVPGRCEAAIHSTRRFLENMPRDQVVVKLDFSNAFNNLHRYEMLTAIRDRLPQICPICHSAYSQPSLLFFDAYAIESQEGCLLYTSPSPRD